jgi:hypothetical protein
MKDQRLTSTGQKYCNDDTINTQDTSHDNGDEASDDQVRTKDTDSGETDTSLSGTVSGTKTCKKLMGQLVNVLCKDNLECHGIVKCETKQK